MSSVQGCMVSLYSTERTLKRVLVKPTIRSSRGIPYILAHLTFNLAAVEINEFSCPFRQRHTAILHWFGGSVFLGYPNLFLDRGCLSHFRRGRVFSPGEGNGRGGSPFVGSIP